MENNETKIYRPGHTVIARIAQCVQEAMIMGYDVTDIFSAMEMIVSPEGLLELNPDYAQRVVDQYKKMEEEAIALHAASQQDQ